MKRLGILSLAGALAATALLPSAGTALVSEADTRVSGLSTFAAGCNGAPQPGTVYTNSEIEPYVAVNPTDPDNLIAVYMQDRWSTGGSSGHLTSVSHDGGKTWTQLPLSDQPTFSRCTGGNAANGGDYERAADPWVSFGPDGVAYQAAAAINRNSTFKGTLVSTSTDGGLTWGPVSTVLREDTVGVSNERPAITADPTKAGAAYVVWDRIARTPERRIGPTLFARTLDGGRTWEEPREIYPSRPGLQTSGNQIVVMPDGDLVNVFNEFEVDAQSKAPRRDWIMAVRSEDGGDTWSVPYSITRALTVGVTDPRDGTRVRTGDIFPEIAVDERAGGDTIYAVWEDARFTGPTRRNQIAFARSTDGGVTWSHPIRVSSTPSTQAWVPGVDVAADGTIAVTYYDFTADSPATEALDTQHWITTSTDGGQTWSPREALTEEPFDMRSGPFSGGFFLGEYQGLESAGDEFKVVASVANSGDRANPTDLHAWTVRR